MGYGDIPMGWRVESSDSFWDGMIEKEGMVAGFGARELHTEVL